MFFTTKAFWMATAERAVKSFGQGVVAALGADQLIDAFALDYVALLGAGAGMGLLSVVTSLGSAAVGEKGAPSLAGETLKNDQP